MLKPRALRPGDRVAIVSPSSPFQRDEFVRGVDELRRLGYEPVWEESVFAREPMVSGSPATRAAAFLRAWLDPDVAALLAVRGGYGSVHLLPLLRREELRHAPKAFIGYSDSTSVLAWLTTGCGIVGFHGPMLAGRLARGEQAYDRASFSAAVSGTLGDMEPDGLSVVVEGECEGVLLGGTMTQLLGSLGTPYAFDPPDGCVLFLEDVNERPYRIDRMLTQLRFAGVLARARGIVFGEMRGCDEPGGRLPVRQVIAEALSDFRGPVLFGFPSGHTTGPCWTLPFGVRARVVARQRGRVIIDEPAVV